MNKIFLKKNYINYISGLILALFEAGFNIYIAFLLKELIDIAITQDVKKLTLFSIKLGIFVVGFVLFSLFEVFISNTFIEKGMINYRINCFQSLFMNRRKIPVGETTGKYISHFTSDMDSIQTNYVDGLMHIISNAILMAVGLVAMLSLNIIMAISIIIVSMLPLFGSVLLSKKVALTEKSVSNQNKRYIETIQDYLCGFGIIKSFGAEKNVLKMIDTEVSNLEKTRKDNRNFKDISSVISQTLSNISIVLTFIIGVLMSINGYVTVGTVIAFIQLLNYVLGPIDSLSKNITHYIAGKTIIEKIEDSLECDMQNAKINVKKIDKIDIRNLDFAYDGNLVLENINISFEKGKSYAIIGSSGSGKTTLLNLIAGSLQNYKGSIELDGIPLDDLSEESIQKLYSIIQQNVMIFNGTIKENITMWRNDFSEEQIQNAIDKASLRKLVDEKSLDYLCGENGNRLSGGERQRISIARAILQESSVLLVDEGFSALDEENAANIEKMLIDLRDKIVISVTHKISKDSLERYDNIIAIKNGTIVEKGTYKELSQAKGYVWALSNL